MPSANSLIGVFLFISLLGCNDKPEPECDDNGLPCLSYEGKNMFACRLDGARFEAGTSFSIGGATPISANVDELTGYLIIEGNYEDSNENLSDVRFRSYVAGPGIYDMHVTTSTTLGYADYSGENCTYYFDQDNPGKLQILYMDTEHNIVSGKFEMTLINPDCSSDSLMYVSDGRFDVRYQD